MFVLPVRDLENLLTDHLTSRRGMPEAVSSHKHDILGSF